MARLMKIFSFYQGNRSFFCYRAAPAEAVNGSQSGMLYDLTKWTYADLRDAINTSTGRDKYWLDYRELGPSLRK